MEADADTVSLYCASKLAVLSSELRDFEEGVPMRFLVLDKGLLAAVDDFVLLEDSVKRVRINRHEMRLDVADWNDVEPFLVVLLVKSVQDDVVPKQWDQTVRRAQPTLADAFSGVEIQDSSMLCDRSVDNRTHWKVFPLVALGQRGDWVSTNSSKQKHPLAIRETMNVGEHFGEL